MRKKLISLISLLVLPAVLADPVQNAFDDVFKFITPDIANYLYTFVLVFAVCQFALNLVMQQTTGAARGATGAMMNPNVIAGALAFGSAFFVYMSKFDMILFTIPWIMFITFGLLFAMVYRVVQLFGGGGGPTWYRPFGIGISLIILSFFLKAIFQYIDVYQKESGIEALTGFAGSFFGLFTSLTGWMLLGGIGFIIYALTQAIGEAGGISNLITGNPPTTPPTPPTLPGPNDPTAAFTAVPTLGVVGDAITFTNTSAPSTGHTITEWYWDFDDGTSETVTVAPGDPTVPKSYAADRTFDVKLRVTDDGGGSPNTATIPITINPATPVGFPTARYSVNGGAPLIQVGTVIFDAGLSTDNAGNDHTHGNLEFHWNFGGAGGRDAGEAPGTSPMGLEHVIYAVPGNYVVILRVQDTATGNDHNHTINFTVEPLTPPPT